MSMIDPTTIKPFIQIANSINRLRRSLARVVRRNLWADGFENKPNPKEFKQLVEILKSIDKWYLRV